MKNKSKFALPSLRQPVASGKLHQEGIPYKLLCELYENVRIYKHLVTVAIMANLLVMVMAVSFIG